MTNRNFLVPFLFGILGLILIFTSNFVEVLNDGIKIAPIAWLASLSIAISFTIIRFYSVDSEKFKDLIISTNPVSEVNLNPDRFLNGMFLAFIVGLIATVTIYYNFIAGALVYLVMQLFLMYSFSGITVLNVAKLKSYSKQRMTALVSIVFWVAYIVIVYVFFVYNGSESLVVIPYVVALGLMAHFSWYGMSYSQRSLVFRLMIVLASAIFVFSDSLIGNDVFGKPEVQFTDLFVLIDITYVINIFLMSQAILFFKDKNGESVLKN